MKRLYNILIILTFGGICAFGQFVDDSTYSSWWENKARSLFKNINNGMYSGIANGYLHTVNSDEQELILDFQSSNTELNIIEDENQVYDNSTKVYSTFTTSGKTELSYKIYALANVISITLNMEEFSIGVIDGACDMPVNGLSFNYCNESSIEYLTLFVTKPLVLSNTRSIMRKEKLEYQVAKEISRELTVFPGSTIIFTIRK